MAVANHFQGMRSSMREAGHKFTTLVSTSAKYVCGSTALSLQVSTSEAMHAQFCAPSSSPAMHFYDSADRPDVSCDKVGVKLDAAVIEETREPGPVVEGIADGICGEGLAREPR